MAGNAFWGFIVGAMMIAVLVVVSQCTGESDDPGRAFQPGWDERTLQ